MELLTRLDPGGQPGVRVVKRHCGIYFLLLFYQYCSYSAGNSLVLKRSFAINRNLAT